MGFSENFTTTVSLLYYSIFCAILLFPVDCTVLDSLTGINTAGFTEDELQQTFGVDHFEDVPHHKTLIPRTRWTNDGRLESVTVSLDDGRTLTIPVELSDVGGELIASDLVSVERHDDNMLGGKLTLGYTSAGCHYRATTGFDNTTHATFSACDGYLRGVIATKSGTYVVHPLPERYQQHGERQKRSAVVENYNHDGRHVIYRRSAWLNNNGKGVLPAGHKNFCAIESDVSEDDMEIDEMAVKEDLFVVGERLTRKSDLVVEIALFIDTKLWKRFSDRHGSWADAKLREFVITAMNNMQMMYHQPTMIPKLQFKVVRYEVMKSEPAALSGRKHSNGHAQTYLSNFCRYQRQLGSHKWDHAFLMSGYNLHRGMHSRSISGIARLHGMCDPWNTCTITEGLDFTSVFIGAHELGHSLGMNHDEPYCSSRFIMSSSLGPGKVTWSECSMRSFHKFINKLDYRNGNCLRNSRLPTALNTKTDAAPGQKYDADQQCAMMHGEKYIQVTPGRGHYDGLCYVMWCGRSQFGRIITSHPALEGTMCADGKWCKMGRCVPWSAPEDGGKVTGTKPKPPPGVKFINGGWSGWATVQCADCRCGTIEKSVGVLLSKRTCTNPAPANGGRKCEGVDVRGQLCKSQCTGSQSVDDYMKGICMDHRNKRHDYELNGYGSQLTRYPARACKIFCNVQASGRSSRNYRFFGDNLPDGAPCGYGATDPRFCISGHCLPVSCNGKALGLREAGCPSTSCSLSDTTAWSQPSTGRKQSGTWSEWSVWSVCSRSCGSWGTKRRSRNCPSGRSCSGSAKQTQNCYEKSCPKSNTRGSWTSWTSWSACPVTCGTGYRRRSRQCSGSFSCGSGSRSETAICSKGYCPWQEWTRCTAQCGTGTQRRTRVCPGGGCSGRNYQDTDCNTQACINWSTWGSWGTCSVTCGGGRQLRTRQCTGVGCSSPKSSERRRCGTNFCNWQTWSSCSVTCGRGSRNRYRSCPSGFCKDKQRPDRTSFETATCDMGSCSRSQQSRSSNDYAWDSWGSWTDCSVTCGKGAGTRARYRHCVRPSDGHEDSRYCTGRSIDTHGCQPSNGEGCPQWSSWSGWSQCSKSCGGDGVKTRARSCPGDVCPGDNQDSTSCGGDSACPENSSEEQIWSSWSQWNDCSDSCGGGVRSRQRICVKGDCTGKPFESEKCNEGSCPRSSSKPLGWGTWGRWSSCSRTCGDGTKRRYRTCFSQASGACPGVSNQRVTCVGGAPCASTERKSSAWSSWSPWSSCSATCGSDAHRKRTRLCVGSRQCPGRSEELNDCTQRLKPCAEWGGWGNWSHCSATCGSGGRRRRIRNCYGWGKCYGGKTEDFSSCSSSTQCPAS